MSSGFRSHVRTAALVAAGLSSLLLPFTAAIAGPPHGGERAPSETLTLAGCDASAPLTRLLARAFREHRPDVRIRLETVGSTNGIALAAAGAIPIGLVSRDLRPSEAALGVTFRPYARTAVVIAADPAVQKLSLATADLLALYRGTKHRWRSGAAVTLLTREEGDSAITTLKEHLPGFADAYMTGARGSHWTVLYSEPAMHEALLTLPFALGLSDLGTVTIERLPVRVLAIDGIAPTLANIASGRYPFTKTLAMVWREERLPEAARAFVEFAHSAEGTALIAAHGYVPVR